MSYWSISKLRFWLLTLRFQLCHTQTIIPPEGCLIFILTCQYCNEHLKVTVLIISVLHTCICKAISILPKKKSEKWRTNCSFFPKHLLKLVTHFKQHLNMLILVDIQGLCLERLTLLCPKTTYSKMPTTIPMNMRKALNI